MTLEHPYMSIYLDGQLKARHGRRRRARPQAYRMVRSRTWVERIFAAALILAAACTLLLAVVMAGAVIWVIGLLFEQAVRWWRG